MLKLMGEINQKLTQTINSHSKSIAKIEAHEEEPSPIYWPSQQESQQEQYTLEFFTEIDPKIEAYVEQIINHLNREE
jgi:hypothetical protein